MRERRNGKVRVEGRGRADGRGHDKEREKGGERYNEESPPRSTGPGFCPVTNTALV